MSIAKYKTFIEVVRCQSMRKAAANLNQTPSSVSYTISSLEEDLGIPLFIRSKSKVTLTSYGQSILPSVMNVLKADKELKEAAASFNGLTTGHIRLGGLQLALARFLPDLVKRMQNVHPGIEISPVLTPYPQLADDLLSGNIDLAFMDRPISKQLDFIPLMKSYYHFILPEGHPLFANKKLAATDLDSEKFIIPAWNSDPTFQKLLVDMNIRDRIAYTIGDISTLMSFVQSGFGIGILTTTTLPIGYLLEYPIIEDSRPVDFGIALPSLGNASLAIREFIRQTKNYFAEKQLWKPEN